jgi:pilus assembly protein CpaF
VLHSASHSGRIVSRVGTLPAAFHLAEIESPATAESHSLDGRDYGPITPLLHDDTISEVMVNGPNQVYIERGGQLTLSDVRFPSEAELVRVIREIASFVGRRIDDDSPMVDCRLPDGSRVNAVIAPLAIDGASLTIRKFSHDPYSVQDLIGFGTLTQEGAGFLEACVKAHFNIIVAGGTGSGKTTTLNVLSSFIPDNERVVTIEDAAELQLRQPHKVRLESRPARIDGTGRISIRDLVVNALRMRPDRIVIGECRSGEALDMLQAMNTGHDGSLTTIHANSPRDTLARLETLVLMSGVDLPQRAIREQIASAIHLIVQQSRLRDGSRRITNITEIVGREGDTITLQDVFTFEEIGVDGNAKIQGKLNPTGIRPNAMAKVYAKKVAISPALAALFPDRKAPDFTLGVRR